MFTMNLLLVFIYKFLKKEIQIQQPGEPWEQHLDEVWEGTLKFKRHEDIPQVKMFNPNKNKSYDKNFIHTNMSSTNMSYMPLWLI